LAHFAVPLFTTLEQFLSLSCSLFYHLLNDDSHHHLAEYISQLLYYNERRLKYGGRYGKEKERFQKDLCTRSNKEKEGFQKGFGASANAEDQSVADDVVT
jgi:hypothetical protein